MDRRSRAAEADTRQAEADTRQAVVEAGSRLAAAVAALLQVAAMRWAEAARAGVGAVGVVEAEANRRFRRRLNWVGWRPRILDN